MPRDSEDLLQDILDAADKIFRYTAGVSFDSFVLNELTFDAVVYNFVVIGEAATILSENPELANMKIPWRDIKGLRNVAVHEYFAINKQLVWKIIQNDLPVFRAQIAQVKKEIKP